MLGDDGLVLQGSIWRGTVVMGDDRLLSHGTIWIGTFCWGMTTFWSMVLYGGANRAGGRQGCVGHYEHMTQPCTDQPCTEHNLLEDEHIVLYDELQVLENDRLLHQMLLNDGTGG